MIARSLVLLAICVLSMPAATAQTPITASRFGISVDGYEIASFSKLELIASETKGLAEFSNDTTGRGLVTLTRPLTTRQEMWAWHEAVILGDVAAARRSVSVMAYSRDGKLVARYNLTNAWPAKIEVGSLKAGASEVLMESVTLVCEHIQRVSM